MEEEEKREEEGLSIKHREVFPYKTGKIESLICKLVYELKAKDERHKGHGPVTLTCSQLSLTKKFPVFKRSILLILVKEINPLSYT